MRQSVTGTWWTLVLALWLSAWASVSAITLVPADLGEMVAGSHVIVRGRVERVQGVVVGPRRTIETLVTLAVLDELKGDASSPVVFRVPGGQVGRYRRVMVGVPDFAEGDEVVVFLRGRAPVVPMPFGVSQGVYRVRPGAVAREVAPLLPEPGPVVRGAAARRLPTVDEFARTVRALSGRQP